jgi:hypothetical protein
MALTGVLVLTVLTPAQYLRVRQFFCCLMSIEEGPINCLNDHPTTYYSIGKVTDSEFFFFFSIFYVQIFARFFYRNYKN